MFTLHKERGNNSNLNLYLLYSPTEAFYFLVTILGIYFTKLLNSDERDLLNCENPYISYKKNIKHGIMGCGFKN